MFKQKPCGFLKDKVSNRMKILIHEFPKNIAQNDLQKTKFKEL